MAPRIVEPDEELMAQPLVSVIICFLNPGDWLREAVDSVLAQDYKEWELILVDDGSVATDSAMARQYAASHPEQIYYLDHEAHANVGLTTSRNRGIRLSRGTFVAFLDADDYWYADKLSSQLDIFRHFAEAAMICEASLFWYSWNDTSATDPVVTIGAAPGLYQPSELIRRLYPLGKGQPPCPSGIILRKDILARSGEFEEIFSGIFQLYEDQAFLAKMYLTEKIYISEVPHNRYRKHSGSMTQAANNECLYARVRNFYLDWLSDYLAREKISDEEIIALIQAARLPAASDDLE